jgi:hypothetical protein
MDKVAPIIDSPDALSLTYPFMVNFVCAVTEKVSRENRSRK